MRIGTFNCNSIRSRLSIVLNWVQKKRPEVLCLQETKVQDKEFPEAQIQEMGYQAFFVGQKAYNGVAILAREGGELISKSLKKDPNNEARFLEIIYKGIFIINVYIPQGTSVESERFRYKLNYLEWLYEYISENHRPDEDLIITGDLNIALTDMDVYDPEAFRGGVCFHPEEQARLLRLLGWGLIDVYRYKYPKDIGYTFWDYRIPNGFKRNLGWRLDYIIATKTIVQRLKDVGIEKGLRAQAKPSDHTLLWAELEP